MVVQLVHDSMHHSDITSWLCKLRSESEWMTIHKKYEHVIKNISCSMDGNSNVLL